MKMKSNMTWMMAGVGTAILYQQIKNGNMKKMLTNMKNKEMKAVSKLEDMM